MTPGLIFLVQAFVVVAVPVALLRFSRLKGVVPLVVIQIAIGIILGPSVFGRYAPGIYHTFVNPASLASLSGIGSVAILVFGLITGLHLDPRIFRDNSRAFSAVAAANVMVPTALGCMAGFWILARHPEELSPGVNPAEFAVSVGICIGMTALPVLGALLGEMDLLGRRIGHLALAIAGINDTALWILLAVLLTAVSGQAAGHPDVVASLIGIPVYLCIMIFAVRPLLGKMVAARMHEGQVQERALALVGAATIASALITELMGLHYIIGAFVTGAVMPEHLRKPILDRLQAMTVAWLLPFFFIYTGMRTVIDPSSSAFIEMLVIASGVAVVGVIGGTAIAARIAGESWPFSLGLGALLHTKGLMELIVLTILLDAKIISPNMFAALILMSLICTALAMPLARLFLARDNTREVASFPDEAADSLVSSEVMYD